MKQSRYDHERAFAKIWRIRKTVCAKNRFLILCVAFFPMSRLEPLNPCTSRIVFWVRPANGVKGSAFATSAGINL